MKKRISSKVEEAFLQQSNIDTDSIDQSKIDEDLFGHADGFGSIGSVGRKLDAKAIQQAAAMMSRSQNISDYIDIPSNLHIDDLNDKTIPHSNMEYDHSLEVKRNDIAGVRDGSDDGIEMGDMDVE